MRFRPDALGDVFWNHLGHLGVRFIDPSGVPVRCLEVKTCVPCRRLWDKLEPMGGGSPAVLGRLYTATGSPVYVRADVDAAQAAPARPKPLCDREPDSVRVVRHFTISREGSWIRISK